MDSSHQIGTRTVARFTIGHHETFSPAIGTIALNVPTIAAQAATPDEQAVLAPVSAMFDGMAKRDAPAIKEPLLPGGTMVLMRDGNLRRSPSKHLPNGSESREQHKSRSAFMIRSCESIQDERTVRVNR